MEDKSKKRICHPTDVYELVNFFEAQNMAYKVDAHGHNNEEKHDKKKKEE